MANFLPIPTYDDDDECDDEDDECDYDEHGFYWNHEVPEDTVSDPDCGFHWYYEAPWWNMLHK